MRQDDDLTKEAVLVTELARQILPYEVGEEIAKTVHFLFFKTYSFDDFLGGILGKVDSFNLSDRFLDGYSVIIGFLAGFMTCMALREEYEPVREYTLEKLGAALAR